MPGLDKNCPKCGVSFSCGASSARCWCQNYPAITPVDGSDCLCPECLDAVIRSRQPRSPLVEGDDYYLEGAAVVFTAAYHLRRGYCCGNRCRHCPYGHEAVPVTG